MRCFAFALCVLVSFQAHAQTPVLQAGPVTRGHGLVWAQNGVVQDAGTAEVGALTEVGVVKSGNGFCQNSESVLAAGYQQICLGATTAGGATLSVQNFGSAPEQNLTFNINGTPYAFPFTVGGIVGPSVTVVNQLPCWNNTLGTLFKNCGTGIDTLPIPATATGTNALTVTPSFLPPGLASAANGLTLTFLVPNTSTVSGFGSLTVTGLSGTLPLYLPDGASLAHGDDLVKGQGLTATYYSSLAGYVVQSPSPVSSGFTSASMNGQITMSAGCADSCSTVTINGAFGGMSTMLFYNPDSGGYRMFRIDGGNPLIVDLFDAMNPPLVDGVAQVASVATLYAIYTEPVGGAFNSTSAQSDPIMSFWTTSSGYTPEIGSNTLLVLCTSRDIMGVCLTKDITRLFLGLVYTRDGNIANLINPAAIMGNAVYSHYFSGRSLFGYATTVVDNTCCSNTSLATQTTPFIDTTTEGVNDTPSVLFYTTASCTGTNFPVTVSTRIQLGGVAFNGVPITEVTPTVEVTLASAGEKKQLVNQYQSAPSMSYRTFQIAVAEDQGSANTCTFSSHAVAGLPQ